MPRDDRQLAMSIRGSRSRRTNVVLGGYFEQFHSLTESPFLFLTIKVHGIFVFFFNTIATVIAMGIPATPEAKVGSKPGGLGCTGTGACVGSRKRVCGTRAGLDSCLASLKC